MMKLRDFAMAFMIIKNLGKNSEHYISNNNININREC